MSNLLDYTWWFIVAYPILGLIIIFVSTVYTNPVILSRIKSLTEILNIGFGIWLLIILINSIIETRETTGKYFDDDTAEWFWYIPICTVLGLISFKKIRRLNFSILLFSFIFFIGYWFSISFFKFGFA